jgi:hypothetical protein
MLTRIQDVNDVQGPTISRITGHRGKLTLPVYVRAHMKFLSAQRGSPVPHESSQPLVMRIAGSAWRTECPECNGGVTTGRLWTEARCFTCGAVFRSVVWPANIDEIERLVLRRPMRHQHWRPEETAADVASDNAAHGVRGG